VKAGGRKIGRNRQFLLVLGWKLRGVGWDRTDLRDAGGGNWESVVEKFNTESLIVRAFRYTFILRCSLGSKLQCMLLTSQ
jgi:hypothetical protein